MMGAAGAASLASALEECHAAGADLANNEGDAGAASLASALEKNSTLQMLDLANNEMGDARGVARVGAREECHAADAPHWPQRGDAGAASLASALEKNATLRELGLPTTRAMRRGVARVGAREKFHAQMLDLANNEMGDAGAASLALRREERHAVEARPLPYWGGRCGRASCIGAREECHTAVAQA